MGWNGSGTVIPTNGTGTGATLWTQTQAAGHAILAADFDAASVDTATAIQACIPRNGEAAATANLPMGNFRHTGCGDGSALTHYATIKQVQAGGPIYCSTNGGTSSALTGSIAIAPSGVTDGMVISMICMVTNVAGVTFNLNGLGAAPIISADTGEALVGEEMQQYAGYLLHRRSTSWVLINPASVWKTYTPSLTGFSPDPTVVARYKLEGKKCTVCVKMVADGVSNSTGMSISAPLTAATITNMGWFAPAEVMDGGSLQAAPGKIYIGSGASTFTAYKTYGSGSWTNSATAKYANFTIVYQVA